MNARGLVWGSFAAWAIGALMLAFTVWQDSHAVLQDDVGAGLAGLGAVIGFGIFVLSTMTGVALGFLATRRAPSSRPAAVALGLNVITLGGALLSLLIRLAR